MNDLVILVTAIGSVAGEYVISRLKELGHKVIGTDIYDRKWIAYGDLPDMFFQVSPVKDEKEYLKCITDICSTEKVDLIFPLTDVEVDFFDHYRDLFCDKEITICISEHDIITVLRNKLFLGAKVSALCKLTTTIPSCYVHDFLCSQQEWERSETRFVIKPVDGRSSQGIRYFLDREEVVYYAKKHDTGAYIIQPYISGDRIVVDVVRQPQDGTIVAVSRKELLSTVNGCGISVLVFSDPQLEMMCKELADKLEICGCVNFEFLLDPHGEYFLLECNPRFSAGIKFSALAGCDCVERHLNSFINKPVERFELGHAMYIARKWTEVVTSIL
ncbi:MAG: ATP-grasp domain-containing protein [Lachnospiraceae bacterium]|nr:ATP-grasp domain-containing protein [Lachnospiraceae bacterium]